MRWPGPGAVSGSKSECGAQQPDPPDRLNDGRALDRRRNAVVAPERLPIPITSSPPSPSSSASARRNHRRGQERPKSRPSARAAASPERRHGSPFGRPDRHGVPSDTGRQRRQRVDRRHPSFRDSRGDPQLAPLFFGRESGEKTQVANRLQGAEPIPRNSYSIGEGCPRNAQIFRPEGGLSPNVPETECFPSRCPFPDRSRKAAVAETFREIRASLARRNAAPSPAGVRWYPGFRAGPLIDALDGSPRNSDARRSFSRASNPATTTE